MRLFRRFLTGKEKAFFAAVLAAVLLQIALEVGIQTWTASITGYLQGGGSFLQIASCGLYMGLTALGVFGAAYFVSYGFARLSTSLCARLRETLFDRMLGFSQAEVAEFGTGSLIYRATDEVSNVEMFMSQCVQPMIQTPVMMAVVIARVAGISFVWGLIAGAALLVFLVMYLYVYVTVKPRMAEYAGLRGKIARLALEHLAGIQVIQACNSADYEEKGYRAVNRRMTELSVKNDASLSIFTPTLSFLMYGLPILVYLTGAFLVSAAAPAEKSVLFSEMVEYISYITMLIGALGNAILVVLYLPVMMNSGRVLKEVLDRETAIRDGRGAETKERGSIEFRDVSFRYPGSGEDALEHLTFSVRPGETVAVTGSTGCGKTSVMNLIPRLFDATGGSVLVDGADVRDYPLHELRSRIGYVPQHAGLFTGTVAQNIAVGDNGRPKASMEEIVAAAVIGQADGFIREKEGQYESPVYPGGANFSGGQRQRLTISRAVCRDPEIYIFDDSFSALDYRTDRAVRHALKEHSKDATMVIVSQRLGSIRDADRILVLDKGRMAGFGTHEELLKSCPVYREIALSQQDDEGKGATA